LESGKLETGKLEGSYKKRRKEKYKRVRMTYFAASKAAKACKSIMRSV